MAYRGDHYEDSDAGRDRSLIRNTRIASLPLSEIGCEVLIILSVLKPVAY
jgi:hypothetical protein